MKKSEKPPEQTSRLRRETECPLRMTSQHLEIHRSAEDAQRLLHELEVHQIELELQNEELRQAREKLEVALDNFTDLYDFAPIGYITLCHDGIITAANLSGAKMLAVERSLLPGQRFELFVADGSRRTLATFLHEVFRSMAKQTCEVELVSNGPPRFMLLEACAGASGKECRLALIDISERRQAEARLAERRRMLEELNHTLELRILEAVEQLRRKDQILIMQDRRAVMGDMINNIAHQWRQPLNCLSLYIQKLPLVGTPGEFRNETLQENADMCLQLIMHMSQTIEDFRNFFKPDKEMIRFAVNPLIRYILNLIGASLCEEHIGTELHTEGEPTITGYPNEYAQVLLNLLSNARDALVERKIANARITIRTFEAGGKTVVTITDNAGGVATEVRAQLFEPYVTTKDPDKGSGVGLFMSQTIIEKNMGGTLTFRNTGEGAEFRIEV
jgi:C4-dicarboxylate-specific signal transduction histidine kinase